MINDLSILRLQFVTLFLLCISFYTHAQENNTVLKEIRGQITYQEAPIPNVNIILKGKTNGTKTDSQGYYSIKAKISDVIQYSHVGFNTVSITIEDVTNILSFEMSPKVNELDEAIVIARSKKYYMTEVEKNRNKPFKTAVGIFKPNSIASNVLYFDESDNLGRYHSFTEAFGSIYFGSGRKLPSIWDVDGIIYYNEPAIDLSQIKDIHVVRSRLGTMRWGGPVIIVRTKYGVTPIAIEARRKDSTAKYVNKNYYNDDAVAINSKQIESTTNTTPIQNELRTISGKITHLDAPLPDVNIKIKGRTRGTKTDSRGFYEVSAKVGEIIEYSYVGFKTVTIIVEDITKEISIDMITEVNELDEVVVIVKTIEGNILKRSKKANRKFSTSRGNVDPKTAGYAVGFIDGDEVSNTYLSIKEALVGKISGYSVDGISGKAYLRGKNTSVTQDYPVAWEVDGNFTTDEPYGLDLSQIGEVYALKSLAATNKYGTLGAGGVIVINTKYGNYQSINVERQKTTDKHTNKSYYNNDAIDINSLASDSNEHTEKLESFNDLQKAYSHYDESLRYQINDYDVHIDIAQSFAAFYKSPNLATQILTDLSFRYNNNPEILKAIGYQLQLNNAKNEAVKTFQEVFKLRPKYAQSYRDLANAYHENDQYKKSWRLYMSYLMQGNDVSDEGIGSILYNEMEYLFFNRQYQTQIKERFVPKNETLEDFRNDVRMVFEWNTSEAEFNLEFVSPDKRSYVFNHSLQENQELITDEKTKGYSSKEFIIDDVGNGEWLINISYNGNKKPEPTYFKVTSYYHWGKANQKKETAVYKFKNEREKFQLKKINKQLLVAQK